MRTVNSMWYTAKEVQILLGVASTQSYKIIKELGNQLVKEGYSKPPTGKIQKKYLCKQYMLDIVECDCILEEEKKKLKG